uniref:Uncharacterized protein n=2 Tax=Aegilops tauschii subsp. strangulata TaxID=200361 RepID=A0A453R7L3_AEGTS
SIPRPILSLTPTPHSHLNLGHPPPPPPFPDLPADLLAPPPLPSTVALPEASFYHVVLPHGPSPRCRLIVRSRGAPPPPAAEESSRPPSRIRAANRQRVVDRRRAASPYSLKIQAAVGKIHQADVLMPLLL